MENSELENLGVWSKCLREHSEVFNPSFRCWVLCQMGNSEWNTSENWFSEVSEFPENSEFSTSPWLTVLHRGCCDFVGLVHLTCWWPNHFACRPYTDTFLCHDEKDLLAHAVTQRYLWYWQLLDHVSDFSHSESVLSCDWAKLYFRGFVIRICFNVKSQWTKKSRFFPKGPATPTIWDMKLCILAITNM